MTEPFLVKDINPGSSTSLPVRLTAVGDALYFRADDGVNGNELWRSDGTEAGTVLVKDIHPGSASSILHSLTAVGDTLFFGADDGVNGDELWTSDGTEAGTVLVKNINPDSTSYYPYGYSLNELTAVGDTLYFGADDGVKGRELWRSDGTEAGTVLVKDIKPGSSSSFPLELTAVGATLYFGVDTGVNGDELWKSDGTEAGTVLVKNINPDDSSYFPYSNSLYELTAVGDTLYFHFRHDEGVVNGDELWRSDGTEAGTVLVKDIIPGSSGSSPSELTAVGDTLYFTAADGVNGNELWRSDGTEAGTVLVKDILPGSSGSSPSELTAVGDTLYFTAADGVNGRELWRSDGTDAGTVLVKDILPGSSGSSPSELTAVGDTLLFRADDGVNGDELWRSDGTEAGTVLVKDIDPGSSGSFLFELTAVGDTLYFNAEDGATGAELWAYTPTSITTDGLAVGIFNTQTDQLVTPLEDGDVFRTDELTGLLTLAAGAGGQLTEMVGSMRLTLASDAGGEVSRVEDVEPYAVFGDRNGDFLKGIPFGPGDYSLAVDVFSDSAGGGRELGSTSYDFSVVTGSNELISIGLYNTSTDQQVASLKDGDFFSTSDLVGPITLAATLPLDSDFMGSVGSMELRLTDTNGSEVTKVENLEPYALFGNRDGDFFEGIEFLPGEYSLQLTAFSERSGNGIAFGSFSYAFTVGEGPACDPVDLSTVTFTSGDDVFPEDLGLASAEITNTGIADTLAGDDQLTGVSCSSDGIGFANSGTLLTRGGNDVISAEGYPTAGIWNRGSINTGTGNDTITALGYDAIINNGSIDLGRGRDLIQGVSTDDGSGYGIRNEKDGVILTGDNADTVLGSGAAAGIYNGGVIDLGAGKDRIIGHGGDTGIDNTGSKRDILTGSGNDSVVGEGMSVGIDNEGTIDTGVGDDEVIGLGSEIGIWGDFGFIQTYGGDDKVHGEGMTGISLSSGGIYTGDGDDLITAIGTRVGIAFNDDLAEISTGRGDDVVNALSGGFDSPYFNIFYDGPGLISLGEGDDTLMGFGTVKANGGPGQDVLVYNPGTYSISDNLDGTYSISNSDAAMVVTNFEAFGEGADEMDFHAAAASGRVTFRSEATAFSSDDFIPNPDLLSSEITGLALPKSSPLTSILSDDKVVASGDLSSDSPYQDGNQSTPPPHLDDQLASSTSTQVQIDPITGLDRQGSFSPTSPIADHLGSSLSSPTDPITGVSSGSNTPTTASTPSTWPSSATSANPGNPKIFELPGIVSNTLLSSTRHESEPTILSPSLLVTNDPLNLGSPLVI